MITLLPILKELCPDVDLETCSTLIDDELLVSLDIITLVAEVASQFDIEIPVEEIIPENFNSLAALDALVNRLEDE